MDTRTHAKKILVNWCFGNLSTSGVATAEIGLTHDICKHAKSGCLHQNQESQRNWNVKGLGVPPDFGVYLGNLLLKHPRLLVLESVF